MSKILIDEAAVRRVLGVRDKVTHAMQMDMAQDEVEAVFDDLHQALEQSVAQIDTSAGRVEKEAETVHEQPAPAPVPGAHKPLTDRYAQTIKDQEAVIHRLQKRYADLEATAVTPAGYAKKIESLIAERDALKAKLAEQPAQQEPVNKYCCHLCFNKSGQMFLDRMILCPECGNKRCPKATNHELPCTNSNEPGQTSSIYTTPPAQTQEPVTLEQECKAFEEWIDSGFINKGHAAFHKFSDRDAYCIDEIQNKWVAWKERAKRITPQAPAQEPTELDIWKARALQAEAVIEKFMTPPAPAQPLTDEQIKAIALRNFDVIQFARDIEAAHGITKGVINDYL